MERVQLSAQCTRHTDQVQLWARLANVQETFSIAAKLIAFESFAPMPTQCPVLPQQQTFERNAQSVEMCHKQTKSPGLFPET